MARTPVSVQEIRVFQTLRAHRRKWLSAADLAEEALVTLATARKYGRRFVEYGIAEVGQMLPMDRYRLKKRSEVLDTDYLDRLESALKMLSGLADAGETGSRRKAARHKES